MDALGGELGDLLSQLQATQEKRSSVKLSERNVVELITKLKQLGLLGDELLHTINGKEFITADRLRADVAAALAAAGGRLELSELPALVGVDLTHCEKQAAAIVAESGGSIIEAGGELITSGYFDALAAEVDDLLQESGVLTLADLAVSYALSSELLSSAIKARAGAAIRGRLDSGVLYTPAYVKSVKARLRGALRGAAAPVTVAAVVRDLGLAAAGAGGSAMVGGLVEELVTEGAVAGALKGGVQGGVWTPAVYSAAQAAAVKGFYQQNGWVAYDTARKMGVANDKAYLAAAFPEGIALETAFASPSLLVQVEAAIEETSAQGGWVDTATLLPPALTATDVEMLLQRTAAGGDAGNGGAAPEKGSRKGKGGAAAAAAAALAAGGEGGAAAPRFPPLSILAGSCVVAGPLLDSLREATETDAKAAAEKAIAERRAGGAAAGGSGKGGGADAGAAGGKKGKGAAQAQVAAGSDEDDDWGRGGGGKKGGKKGKGGKGGGGGAKAAGGKGGAAGAGAGGDDGSDAALSVARLAAKVVELHPDMEGAGMGDPDLPTAIAELLRPAAVAAYQAALTAAFTAGADARRKARDAAARALEEAFVRLQLYGHGCEELQDDEQLQQLLSRHAARTTGAEAVDALLRWCQLEAAADDEAVAALAAAGENPPPLAPSERSKMVKGLSPDVAGPVGKAVDALASGGPSEVIEALEGAASDAGLRLRRLDKKSEKAAVAAARARLLGLLSAEQDPAAALALALPLLHLKATGRLLSIPGRAMGPVLARLKGAGSIPDEGFAALSAFLDDVVESLKQQGGGGGEGEGSEERAGRLAVALPTVKALAGAE